MNVKNTVKKRNADSLKAEKELRSLVACKSDKVRMGDPFKCDTIKVLLKKNEVGDFLESGKVICIDCDQLLAHSHGSHVLRHVDENCPSLKKRRKRMMVKDGSEVDHEAQPVQKNQRTIDFFNVKKFREEELAKLCRAMSRYCVKSGKSYNHMSSSAMEDFVVDICNSVSSGYGIVAKKQLPSRQTVQKYSEEMAKQVIARAYEKLFMQQFHLVLPSYKNMEKRFTKFEQSDFTGLEIDSLDTEVVRVLSKSALLSVQHYIKEFTEVHYGAVLLTPAMKRMKLFDNVEKERANKYVMLMLPKEPTPPRTLGTEKKLDQVSALMVSFSDEPAHNDLTNSELERYIAEPVDTSLEESVEQYWKRKSSDYPNLTEVAAQTFSVIPSEAICESTFSVAGFLLDSRRTRLQYSRAELIVVASQLASKYPDWV